jgi:hypothetical protein
MTQPFRVALPLALLALAACALPDAAPQPTVPWGTAPAGQPAGQPVAAAPAPAADPWAGGQTYGGGGGAAPVAGAAPTTAGAGSLTFSVPTGFVDAQGWYVAQQETPGGGSVMLGLVRVLPAIAPQANFGDALVQTWKSVVPTGPQEALGGMVYRRYVGDGLFSMYVTGWGREEGALNDSWWAVLMIDCGDSWQPVITVGGYNAPGERFATTTLDMVADGYIPSGMALTEPFLAGLRCNGERNRSIVDASALAGHYYFGSQASGEYINTSTGATSMHYVSYGGSYDLRTDGTVTYKFTSASNQGYGMQVGKDGGEGTWSVAGDVLVVELDGKKPEYMRVAGLTQFSDAKIAILLPERSGAATPSAVSDKSYYYSTAKK